MGVSDSESGPWKVILTKEMGYRGENETVFRFGWTVAPAVSSRYVKFNCLEYWGFGCALHYFGVSEF